MGYVPWLELTFKNKNSPKEPKENNIKKVQMSLALAWMKKKGESPYVAYPQRTFVIFIRNSNRKVGFHMVSTCRVGPW